MSVYLCERSIRAVSYWKFHFQKDHDPTPNTIHHAFGCDCKPCFAAWNSFLDQQGDSVCHRFPTISCNVCVHAFAAFRQLKDDGTNAHLTKFNSESIHSERLRHLQLRFQVAGGEQEATTGKEDGKLQRNHNKKSEFFAVVKSVFERTHATAKREKQPWFVLLSLCIFLLEHNWH